MAPDHIGGKGMQQELDPGFVEQVERHQLEDLGIKRHHESSLLGGRNRASGLYQAPQEAV